jgi:hypothetical protein
MWMDAYVQQTLIRQQIEESNRTAALRHLVRAAQSARARRPWWPGLQRFVRACLTVKPQRPAARVAVR